jgi:hypothetical protein
VVFSRGDYFRFGLVFIKKSNQTEIIFFLKKKPETEPKPGQTDRFRFGSVCFLGQKPVQTGLALFFRFWLGFLGFGSVFFRVWLGFFWFGSVFLVWLSFFLVFCRFRFGLVFLVFCL